MRPRRRPKRSEGRLRGGICEAGHSPFFLHLFPHCSTRLPALISHYEKKQITHRLPVDFVSRVLQDFNSGRLNVSMATRMLGIGKTRLYELRHAWLKDRKFFLPTTSGGNHNQRWPLEVDSFLKGFLPLQNPPNYQLVCDEMDRLCGFKRARSSLRSYVQNYFPHLVPPPVRKPRTYRRFRRAYIGELWQHDSSIHQWWPAEDKQVLLLTLDDHSGLNLAGCFVESDTTWNHFCHFRQAFETWGIPQAIYTDALSLFGPSSTNDRSDPRSEFQRALKDLGVAHLVAPTPQAKGKIERRFGTFQKRMVTLLAHAKVQTWIQANEVLQMEITRQNRTLSRSTDKIPLESWNQQILNATTRIRPCPAPSLLDLHFSLRHSRRVNLDQTIDFAGQNYVIAPTTRKSVTIILHPDRKLWILQHPPTAVWPPVLGQFSL